MLLLRRVSFAASTDCPSRVLAGAVLAGLKLLRSLQSQQACTLSVHHARQFPKDSSCAIVRIFSALQLKSSVKSICLERAIEVAHTIKFLFHFPTKR